MREWIENRLEMRVDSMFAFCSYGVLAKEKRDHCHDGLNVGCAARSRFAAKRWLERLPPRMEFRQTRASSRSLRIHSPHELVQILLGAPNPGRNHEFTLINTNKT